MLNKPKPDPGISIHGVLLIEVCTLGLVVIVCAILGVLPS